jgi:hypothetical protein
MTEFEPSGSYPLSCEFETPLNENAFPSLVPFIGGTKRGSISPPSSNSKEESVIAFQSASYVFRGDGCLTPELLNS